MKIEHSPLIVTEKNLHGKPLVHYNTTQLKDAHETTHLPPTHLIINHTRRGDTRGSFNTLTRNITLFPEIIASNYIPLARRYLQITQDGQRPRNTFITRLGVQHNVAIYGEEYRTPTRFVSRERLHAYIELANANFPKEGTPTMTSEQAREKATNFLIKLTKMAIERETAITLAHEYTHASQTKGFLVELGQVLKQFVRPVSLYILGGITMMLAPLPLLVTGIGLGLLTTGTLISIIKRAYAYVNKDESHAMKGENENFTAFLSAFNINLEVLQARIFGEEEKT